jgi:hypothetical protein
MFKNGSENALRGQLLSMISIRNGWICWPCEIGNDELVLACI